MEFPEQTIPNEHYIQQDKLVRVSLQNLIVNISSQLLQIDLGLENGTLDQKTAKMYMDVLSTAMDEAEERFNEIQSKDNLYFNRKMKTQKNNLVKLFVDVNRKACGLSPEV